MSIAGGPNDFLGDQGVSRLSPTSVCTWPSPAFHDGARPYPTAIPSNTTAGANLISFAASSSGACSQAATSASLIGTINFLSCMFTGRFGSGRCMRPIGGWPSALIVSIALDHLEGGEICPAPRVGSASSTDSGTNHFEFHPSILRAPFCCLIGSYRLSTTTRLSINAIRFDTFGNEVGLYCIYSP